MTNHTNPLHRTIRVAIICATILILCALATFHPEADYPPNRPQIMEDDPRWDCATMGNRICGPAN